MEKASGLELDWFREYFVFTTDYPDYGIGDVNGENGKTLIKLNKLARFPMPLDLAITYKDGTKTLVNIPLRIMRGEKKINDSDMQVIYADDWPWTHPTYDLEIPFEYSTISRIEIDPSQNMLDTNRLNNEWKPSPE